MLNAKEPVERESLKRQGSDWWNQFLQEVGSRALNWSGGSFEATILYSMCVRGWGV